MVINALKKLSRISLFAYIALFPYGQLPSFLLSLVSGAMKSFHPSDAALGLFVLSQMLLPSIHLRNNRLTFVSKIVMVLLFSLIIGVGFGYFSIASTLYLCRLLLYLFAGVYLFKLKPFSKDELTNLLLMLGFVIAIFGLVQYSVFPDLRAMKAFGWDDHYFRLAGTFFDPSYIGILLVISLLLSLFTLKSGLLKYSYIAITFLALLLTYSRASYVSLMVGIIVFASQKSKMLMKVIVFAVIFAGTLILLPRPESEGVKLERTFSVVLRLKNYKETLSVWRSSPVFGVGFNNICQAKAELLDQHQSLSLVSNSCSGADNSLLFLLATTGLSGLLMFVLGFKKVFKLIHPKDRMMLTAILSSILAHSLFSNSLFYPWVMGWLILFISGVIPKEYK